MIVATAAAHANAPMLDTGRRLPPAQSPKAQTTPSWLIGIAKAAPAEAERHSATAPLPIIVHACEPCSDARNAGERDASIAARIRTSTTSPHDRYSNPRDSFAVSSSPENQMAAGSSAIAISP